MAGLSIENARKSFGETQVLRGVSIEVADGEFAVIVGPSGCGKSTLLRAVAGLEELSEGRIVIGGRDVTDLPPSQRGIAMVFQSYALYPHLTVRENMAFGLKIAKATKAEVDAAVNRAAAILNIEPLLDRKPAALSGGQRQRVAIGRAIVRQPQIFLFDEPLSNLDADLRVRMRYEFAKLHRQLGTTTLYVTHDQVEAMTLADRIIVLRDGIIEQVGSPRDLYERPANIFVAQFLGTPRMNILNAVVADGDQARLDDGRSLALPALAAPIAPGTAVSVGIRPEDVRIGAAPGALPFTIGFVERLGGLATVHLQAAKDSEPIACQLRDDGSLREGETVAALLPPDRLHLFDADGGALRREVRE
ncbi:MAG: sn-glycerol-3-phosphate ABC transporter ATP-binding protein UgpC [Alphaproteobacteria bacterium]|nr:sn-glycerol-3-phosphate ABC transporter ATP-binding protein UgpC [Alphaproteobacteria bacterium]MBU0865957.1 sn-glycerol-3-phosphate ABC transporter ATP-binding protein UgpC [Alphaproteobacteria bacterium]MBU1825220.1 sn-glycerol-3-phosphate ABC transporter ATP-binding protein UgpC [Alphaproteobacteria bacterium]